MFNVSNLGSSKMSYRNNSNATEDLLIKAKTQFGFYSKKVSPLRVSANNIPSLYGAKNQMKSEIHRTNLITENTSQESPRVPEDKYLVQSQGELGVYQVKNNQIKQL